MKTFLSLVIAVLSCTEIIAQNKANLFTNYQRTTRGQYANFGILANPQSQMQFAPFLIYGSTYTLKNQSFGLGFKLIYFNAVEDKKVKLYLLSSIQYTLTPSSIQTDNFTEKILQHTFGYGLRLKIFNRFYLFQELGAGYQLGFPNSQITGRESFFLLPAGLFNIGVAYE